MKLPISVIPALLGLMAAAAQANPYIQLPFYPGGGPSMASIEVIPVPEQYLRQGIDRLKGFMAGVGEASPKEIRAFIDQEIAPEFDFAHMARWVAGGVYWRMDASEKARFTAKLSDLFLSALARNLGTSTQPLPRIDVYSSPVDYQGNTATVRARIIPVTGYPNQLAFRFYRSRWGWRIIDVTANGSSAIVYYRHYFNNLMRRYGLQALTG